MPFTTDFADGYASPGETKRLEVTPQTPDGSALTPDTLDATVTHPDGSEDTYAIGDFDVSGDTYALDVDLADSAGRTHVFVKATDGQERVETVEETIYVQD